MKIISKALKAKRKINKHSRQEENNISSNKNWIIVIDILITLVLAATLYYIFFTNAGEDFKYLRYFGFVAIGVYGCFLTARILAFILSRRNTDGKISKLILLDEDGANVKTWAIKNKVSLLIGKSKADNVVDIDLSCSEYASLISRQHAVLNYAKETWYIEDLGSSNGSGIQRANGKEKFKLENDRPYKLELGDTIYIANTKILVG
jgi:hypothetical protein